LRFPGTVRRELGNSSGRVEHHQEQAAVAAIGSVLQVERPMIINFTAAGRKLWVINATKHLEACKTDVFIEQQNLNTTTPMGKLLF
jgi:hypothetical protein